MTNGIQPKISDGMNARLISPVSMGEVRTALFHMEASTSPGPDGMMRGFFQKYWEVVGHDLKDAIRSFMHPGKLLRGMNHTNLVLIPKVKCLVNMMQPPPISLCNVGYKILGKSS